MNWILFTAFLLAGIIIGLIIGYCRIAKLTIGFLREDTSDPDSPYLFMELTHSGLDKIHRNKIVILKVKLENYIQKKSDPR